ncbi:type VI secretion system lipoprotein TssJ [Niveibacterium sp. 24ML]|uniref:type VI secretion system lipoprotein TssJ n=1 Tax=Niveibacterium sp. 24ML TaxID=2985512 RepID=UPI00226FF904|nr:type VI secretion system lipoprotein TssJ [Niveibacterium sp. 24ML]MCX9156593.1 type VI secretion system lipoprotein TssJ [Niveibacterium sp. 24ML]
MNFVSRRTLLVAGACVVLSACGGKTLAPPPPPTVVQLTVAAEANANPDARGRATPVVVRYYLLANAGPFEAADFFSLFDSDEKTLGATMVSREEVTLKPGDSIASRLAPQSEAKALGVFVAFRDPNKTQWRAVVPVPANKTTAYTVAILKDRVTISTAP